MGPPALGPTGRGLTRREWCYHLSTYFRFGAKSTQTNRKYCACNLLLSWRIPRSRGSYLRYHDTPKSNAFYYRHPSPGYNLLWGP